MPKRMKVMAEAFLGRSLAYDEALRGDMAGMEAALKRNVFGGRKDARQLAAYVLLAEAGLAVAEVEAFAIGPVPFPSASVEAIP